MNRQGVRIAPQRVQSSTTGEPLPLPVADALDAANDAAAVSAAADRARRLRGTPEGDEAERELRYLMHAAQISKDRAKRWNR